MNKQLLFFCGISTAIVIAATYLIIPPILSTQDDVFAEYMLGNGFPQATIRVAYFDYNFLFYEKIFAWLYSHFTNFNWLSSYYVLLHWLSGCMICYTLLNYKKNIVSITALIMYLLLFFVPLITKVSHTSVAGHCIVASFFVLFSFILQNKIPSYKILVLLLLFTVAGAGLRAHILLPLMVIAFGAMPLIKQKIIFKRVAGFGFLLAIITVACIAFHHKDYEHNIPNWKNIKISLDAYFHIANTSYDEGKIEQEKNPVLKQKFLAIRNGFLIYDSTLMDPKLLQQFISTTQKTDKFTSENFETLLWVVNDAKQPLFCMLVAIVFLALYCENKREKYTAILVFIVMSAINCYLVFYMKNAERIWMPLLLLSFLIVYYILLTNTLNVNQVKTKRIFLSLLVLLVFVQTFSMRYLRWRTSYRCIMFESTFPLFKQMSNTLFLESTGHYSGRGLNFSNMPLFAIPSKHPAPNVCGAFFFNFGLTEKTLKQFGFTEMNESFYNSDKVLFMGKPDSTLVNFIYATKHIKLQFLKVDSLPSSCVDLFKPVVIK